MSANSASAEATLLYGSAPSCDLTDILDEIRNCVEHLGETVSATRSVPGEHVLLHCGAVQILVAYCGVPFDVALFKGASRPNIDAEAEARAFASLHSHKASATVLVTDRPDAFFKPRNEQKRRMCWEIADLVVEETGADLVFWCDNDMLFTADEIAGTSHIATDRFRQPKLVSEAIPTVPFMADTLNLDFLELDRAQYRI